MASAKSGGGVPPKGTVPIRPAQGQDFTMAKEEEVLPARPSYVAERKNAVKLYANYFTLSADQNVDVYKYNFTILGGRKQEDEIKGASARQIFKSTLPLLHIPWQKYATDYRRQIVTLKTIEFPEDEKKFTVDGCIVRFDNPVHVRLNTSVSGTPSQDMIDCFNLILGQERRKSSWTMTTIGRHRFFPLSEKKFSDENNLGDVFETPISEMLSVSRGFYQSVRPAMGQLRLNVNTTFGVFRPHGEIKDLYYVLKGRHSLAQHPARKIDVLSKLHEVISRARVHYRDPGAATAKEDDSGPKTMPIAGFARKTDSSRDKDHPLEIFSDFPGPGQVTFWIKEGKQWARRTVKDHFQRKYGLVIDPELPLINKGKPNRPDYVPAECCKLAWGQQLRCKLTEIPGLSDTDLQNLNQFTCRGPDHSEPWIRSAREKKHMMLDRAENGVLQNFGVSVGENPMGGAGRELSAPALTYTGKEEIWPKNGSWLPRAKGPFQAGSLRSWTWICFGESATLPSGDLAAGIKELQRHLERVCGRCPEPEALDSRRITMAQGIATLSRELGRAKVKGVQLVVLILPSKLQLDTYNQVKFVGDIRHGIHTCCVLQKHFVKANWNYFANVALKITLKLGGVNHRLLRPHRLLQGAKTMVVGYDVTHPTGTPDESQESKPEESGAGEGSSKVPNEAQVQSQSTQDGLRDPKKEQSQVGLVASVDRNVGQWSSFYWNQVARQEMVDKTITDAFKSRLKAWMSVNDGKLPENVVIYRDGVSESQFEQVLRGEVPKIRKACSELYTGTQPRITLVLAIKRHTVRFFLQSGKTNEQSIVEENIRPGTVVDAGVTQDRYWEFYLAAHAAIKGTTKPTRYVVVLDEIFVNEFPPNNAAEQLEIFTHSLSYVYGRANRAVCVCTPAYYADILCTRARAYTSALDNERFKSEMRKSIAGDQKANEQQIMGGRIHPDLENSMYWI